MKPLYLVQYELAGHWHTCAKRSGFSAATAKARSEYRAMKGAHMTAIIRKDDVDASMFRRRLDENFELV